MAEQIDMSTEMQARLGALLFENVALQAKLRQAQAWIETLEAQVVDLESERAPQPAGKSWEHVVEKAGHPPHDGQVRAPA